MDWFSGGIPRDLQHGGAGNAIGREQEALASEPKDGCQGRGQLKARSDLGAGHRDVQVVRITCMLNVNDRLANSQQTRSVNSYRSKQESGT